MYEGAKIEITNDSWRPIDPQWTEWKKATYFLEKGDDYFILVEKRRNGDEYEHFANYDKESDTLRLTNDVEKWVLTRVTGNIDGNERKCF